MHQARNIKWQIFVLTNEEEKTYCWHEKVLIMSISGFFFNKGKNGKLKLWLIAAYPCVWITQTSGSTKTSQKECIFM